MKKIVTMLLLALLIACSAAYAEGIDFSSMSTDELLALREELNAEIESRIGVEAETINKGIYTVGEDIKAGTYTISYKEGGFTFQVFTFSTVDDFNAYKASNGQDAACMLMQYGVNPNESAYVNLKDGMVIVINGEGKIMSEKPSFAP